MKYLSVKEFRDFGFLQEVNRRILHPMGIALSVEVYGDEVKFGPIWDCREDPEGIRYSKLNKDEVWEKAVRVSRLLSDKAEHRAGLFCSHIQPLDTLYDE